MIKDFSNVKISREVEKKVEEKPKKAKKQSRVSQMMKEYEERMKNRKNPESKIDLNLKEREMAILKSKKINNEMLTVSIGDLVKYKQAEDQKNDEQKDDRQESRGTG